MAGLLYREDMDEVRKRLTTWWNGGDIGRPAMDVQAPRPEPIEHIEVMPEPEGWSSDYSTSSYEYRVNLAARACVNKYYLGEAVPVVAPDLGPGCLGLYLGCSGVETLGTVWFKPCMESPEDARFEFDPESFYWQFTLRLARDLLRMGKGKFLPKFVDLIEGLDTLAAMRGNAKLLVDLLERPDWVHGCLRQITDRYFDYYDILYDMFRDEVGGSYFWAWAPGRASKLQCDVSAMISPEMFGEFMVPVLTEMCERMPYSMYHWDGPGALPHHDHLLSIAGLPLIQWQPGAGQPPTWHRTWWPLYHKSFDGGKKMLVRCETIEHLSGLKREFGEEFKQFYIWMETGSLKDAEESLRVASD